MALSGAGLAPVGKRLILHANNSRKLGAGEAAPLELIEQLLALSTGQTKPATTIRFDKREMRLGHWPIMPSARSRARGASGDAYPLMISGPIFLHPLLLLSALCISAGNSKLFKGSDILCRTPPKEPRSTRRAIVS